MGQAFLAGPRSGWPGCPAVGEAGRGVELWNLCVPAPGAAWKQEWEAVLREPWPEALPAPARSPLWRLYSGRTPAFMEHLLCARPAPVSTCPRPVCLSGPNARSLCPLRADFSPNGKINHRVSLALRSALWLWSLRAAGPAPRPSLSWAPGWPAGFLSHLTAPAGGTGREASSPREAQGSVPAAENSPGAGPGGRGTGCACSPPGGLWAVGHGESVPSPGVWGGGVCAVFTPAPGSWLAAAEAPAGGWPSRKAAEGPCALVASALEADGNVKAADRSCFLN